MIINDLQKIRYKPKTAILKRQVVQSWRLGFLKLKDIIVTLRIQRHEFRRWVRWEYRQRVSIHLFTHQKPIIMAKKENRENKEIDTNSSTSSADVKQLENLIKQLKTQLAEEKLRNQALNIMLDIGKEDYGLDLRKKQEAKQLKK